MPPVIEHSVHEKVRVGDDHRYGCKGREKYADGYWAPDRQYLDSGRYIEVMAWVENRMSRQCRFDMSLTDPRCKECINQGSGEAYDQMIRSQGS